MSWTVIVVGAFAFFAGLTIGRLYGQDTGADTREFLRAIRTDLGRAEGDLHRKLDRLLGDDDRD